MAENLQQFVMRRRAELDAEVARLTAEMITIEAERSQIDQVAMMLAASNFGPVTLPADQERTRSPKRASESTIKEMVLAILGNAPSGLQALDILERINNAMDVPYPRTSLSPQLSRLKADGKIHREGRLWMLGDGPDIAADPDDILDASRDEDRQINGVPADGDGTPKIWE